MLISTDNKVNLFVVNAVLKDKWFGVFAKS